MVDFDVESKGDAEQRNRLFVDTLAQKIDTELRNPDVNWASKRDATRDPGSDFILRRAVSGGDGGTPTIDGDLDMLMYDILNIDTLRFKSDSPFHITSDKAQIRSNLLGEELNFYVPTGKSHLFYIGNTIEMSLSSAINTLRSDVRFDGNVTAKRNVSVEGNISTDGTVDADGNISTDGTVDADGKITAGKEIKVGSKTGTLSDGMIWYEANKLKARINGETVNLGEGTTTPTVPEPTVATGAFWLPIQTYSASSISGVTNADLDTAFGAQQGSIGVLKPASNFSAGAYGFTFLVFKGRHGATSTSNSRKWFYIPFTGRRSSTIASTGLRDNALDYSRQRQAPQANHAASIPTNNILGGQRGKGKWGIYYQNTEWDEASLFVYITATTLRYKEKTGELSSGSVFSGDVSSLPSTIKTVTGNPDNAGLDTAFGADDGSCGVRLGSDNWFYVKVGGYWFYIDLTTSGTGP